MEASNGQVLAHADPAWTPPHLDQLLVAAAITNLAQLERYMAPAPDEALILEITVLLAHFFVPGMDAALQTATISDWLDDLSAYPLWAIKSAAREWRLHHDRRPSIAAMIRECEFWVSDARADLQLLRRLVAAQPPPKPITTH